MHFVASGVSQSIVSGLHSNSFVGKKHKNSPHLLLQIISAIEFNFTKFDHKIFQIDQIIHEKWCVQGQDDLTLGKLHHYITCLELYEGNNWCKLKAIKTNHQTEYVQI